MERIEEFLSERRKKHLLRRLRPAHLRKEGKIYINGREYIDLSSNDYLGLSHHALLREAAQRALAAHGAGASASRLLSGDLTMHHQLEERVARFKGKERALLFNTGYQANVGVIAAVCKKKDAIFFDRLSHASIIDGVRLSGAKFFRFNHNDTEHLERLLKKERRHYDNALIVTETVFSMDGDRAPLQELAALKEKYRCTIMVDEAHATGIFGVSGSGLTEEDGVTGMIDLVMGTFGKALGSFGAYVASSAMMADYLVNACRSFIYSTALPPPVIAANLAALTLVQEEPFRRRREALLANAGFFRRELIRMGFSVRGSSQIVPVVIGESGRTAAISQELRGKGYWILPIRQPTVPAKEARLRFSLCACHDRGMLRRLLQDIYEADKVLLY